MRYVRGCIAIGVHTVGVLWVPALWLDHIAIAAVIVSIVVLVTTFVQWLLLIVGMLAIGAYLKDVAENFVFLPVARLLNIDLVNTHFHGLQG